MKYIRNGYLLIISILFFVNCSEGPYPKGVEESISKSGFNASELRKVLNYYKQDNADSLKYQAACFLIDNMKWHKSNMKVVNLDEKLDTFWRNCDVVYSKLITYQRDKDLVSDRLQNTFWDATKVINTLVSLTIFDTLPEIERGTYKDLKTIDSQFLIEHIDNAFEAWHNSKYASYLSFEEFCEYILPYRSVVGYPYYESGAFFNQLIGKQILKSTEKDFRSYLVRYNHYTANMWGFSRNINIKEAIGIYDIFLGQVYDCITTASNGCNVFRSCGLPVVVDYCIGFRELEGRHYHCAFLDTTGVWRRFNAASSYLDTVSPIIKPSLNIYRNTFATQKQSPYFLKSKTEIIPKEFNSPCITDVTKDVYDITSIKLPFEQNTSNNMAYLYTFNRNKYGILPVTWGVRNRDSSQVIFKNVQYGVMYFPMYLEEREPRPFGQPFYLVKDSILDKYKIANLPINKNLDSLGTLFVNRKYPPKKSMQELAQKMIGGKFMGANMENYADTVELMRISEVPKLYPQEYLLDNEKAFHYYLYIAPNDECNIAELEYIAIKDSTISMFKKPTPLPIFSEKDTIVDDSCEKYVVPLFNDSISRYSSIIVDGKWVTKSYYKTEELFFDNSVCIKKIRMCPGNADNMVKPGCTYKLFYWNDGWIALETQKARYNYLKFKNVPLNKLYWLKNLDEGDEELPFVYVDGKQQFIYTDLIDKFSDSRYRPLK